MLVMNLPKCKQVEFKMLGLRYSSHLTDSMATLYPVYIPESPHIMGAVVLKPRDDYLPNQSKKNNNRSYFFYVALSIFFHLTNAENV